MGTTLYYEWCMWLSPIPGALGLFLRKFFWPRLLGSCGKGVLFGTNVILRHPHRIHLGDRVVVSENSIIDARNNESEDVIALGDDVILSNNVMISCKNGTVRTGSNVGIGAYTVIQSTANSPVTIGSEIMIGPQCYIVGGGSYNTERLDIPIWRQGIKSDSGVTLEDDIWIGAKVTVLGGVVMGGGSVAAAGAIVTKSIPERSICLGQPARVVKSRDD
jgi:galactoside O-acetyltransferase